MNPDDWNNATPAATLPAPRRSKGDSRAPDLDRLPPHSPEAEQGVVGCFLLGGAPIVDAARAAGLVPEWFYTLAARDVYESVLSLMGAGSPVDSGTVLVALIESARLEQVGGAAFISTLGSSTASSAQLDHWLSIVREKFMLRQAIATCTDVVTRAYASDGEADTLLEAARCDIEDLLNEATTRNAESMRDLVPRAIDALEDEMDAYHRGSVQLHGLTTPFPYADKIWGGIGGLPGENGILGLVAARPGDGKTTIAMQIAEHVSLNHKWFTPKKNPAGEVQLNEHGKPAAWDEHTGLPVMIFSLEQTARSLVKGMAFRRAGVDSQKFRTGFATKGDFDKLTLAFPALNKAPIFIDDDDSVTIDDIAARARLAVRQLGIRLFIVDYVQLVQPPLRRGTPNRVQEMSDVSAGFKRLAKRLDTPFIVLCQMNREFEKEKGQRKPKMGDLRDSGSLEQDAHWITFIYEPELSQAKRDEFEADLRSVYGDKCFNEWTGTPRKMSLLFAKNRHGLKDKEAALLFNGAGHGFEDYFAWRTRNGLREPSKGEKRERDGDIL